MLNDRNYTITGHMVVKNEDRWIWYSIMSVIDFLDRLIIFDTGSRDHTTDIIAEILKDKKYADKILYKEWGAVTPKEFSEVRQKQIEMTKTDYFMVIDGDEIWYEATLNELNTILSTKKPLLVATKFINACGDIFHYRYEKRETYCINGIKGAITIRVFSMKIPGISVGGVYGVEGYIDSDGDAVQEKGYPIIVQKGKYFHTSLLVRSSRQNGDFSIRYRRAKLRATWDEKFPSDFKYPEVFNKQPCPQYVSSPYKKDFNFIRWTYYLAKRLKGFIKRD